MRGVIVTASAGVELIAATTDGASAAFDGVIWLAAIVLCVMVATVIWAYLRGRMRSSMYRDERPEFDLAELRRLRETGQVSATEYKNLERSLYPDIK